MTPLVPVLRLVLCAYLLLWEPLNLASEALQAWSTLGARGNWAIAELTVHGVFAMLAVAGGIALWHRSPHAIDIALVGLFASTGRMIQVGRFSMLPHDITPDMRWLLGWIALAHALFWARFLTRYEDELTDRRAGQA